MKIIKIFYICAAIFLIVIFLILLYRPIQTAFHEEDLWWMIPLMSSNIENQSFFGNLKLFLFNPYYTSYIDPLMDSYLFLVLSIFGFQTKYFIFTSLIIHFLCAFLLYLVLRKLDLDFKIAFFSALIYLTMFIHFCSYIWPMAIHHLFVLFFSLLILYLYFETTKRIDNGRNWRYFLWLTICANFLASFCLITILLLPVGILAHILVSSKNGWDRLKKYEIWMPFFIIYLGYPLMKLIYIGCPHLNSYLHIEFKTLSTMGLFPIVFLLGISLLFLFRGILQLSCRYQLGKILKNLCIASIILYILIYIATYGRDDLLSPFHSSKVKLYEFLSPYNFIHPFSGIFVNFISPLTTALSINSTVPYHEMPMQNDIIGVFLSLFFIILFMNKYFLKHKGLVVFLIFYIFTFRYTLMKTSISSRYFGYITPLFAVVFCCTFIYIYDFIMNKIKLKRVIQEIILILIFIGLCTSNILAIKLEIFRGRLVNTFLIYDYLRTADIIKHDIKIFGTDDHIKSNDIFIEGVFPMPFDDYWPNIPANPLKFDTFRYVFAQTLNDTAMFNINVNIEQSDQTKRKLIYKIKDSKIYDIKDSNIDKFSLYFDEAVKELKLGNNRKASILFKEAIEIRPFLLNYVLARYELKDLRWITNGDDLKDWISDIINYYDSWKEGCSVKKLTYISSVIKDEINNYIKCLFYKAYLDYFFGRPTESKDWLLQIGFLENNYGEVSSLLNKELPVQSNQQILDFLHSVKIFNSPDKAKTKGFYGFLSQLIFNREVL